MGFLALLPMAQDEASYANPTHIYSTITNTFMVYIGCEMLLLHGFIAILKQLALQHVHCESWHKIEV